ncbi:MAG TPA: hypothetical protein VNC78_01340 [Actinomycetota bacterium]|nr:hypothetical protein [Actinomycetota bacterium]
MSIDQDLFQLIVIALLAISLLVSLLNLSTLSRVKKQLNESSFAPASTGSLADLGSSDSSFVSPYAAQEATAQPSAYEPAAAQPVQAQATPQQVYAQPAYSAPEPVQAAPIQAAPVQAAPVETSEPQEQPFERDGRWWFRRGAELLVYDEQTAQWVPAPSGAGGAVTTATLTDGGAGGDTGSFWKCPSCGAVNGSTATSCRMCFTARS